MLVDRSVIHNPRAEKQGYSVVGGCAHTVARPLPVRCCVTPQRGVMAGSLAATADICLAELREAQDGAGELPSAAPTCHLPAPIMEALTQLAPAPAAAGVSPLHSRAASSTTGTALAVQPTAPPRQQSTTTQLPMVESPLVRCLSTPVAGDPLFVPGSVLFCCCWLLYLVTPSIAMCVCEGGGSGCSCSCCGCCGCWDWVLHCQMRRP